MHINVSEVHIINDRDKVEKAINEIKDEFKEVFDKTNGPYNTCKISVKLKEHSKPRYMKPRPVPYAIKDKNTEQLEHMVIERALQPIEKCEYGTSIVAVAKNSKELRLCGDYKVTINKDIIVDRHPMPSLEKIHSVCLTLINN